MVKILFYSPPKNVLVFWKKVQPDFNDYSLFDEWFEYFNDQQVRACPI